MKGTRGATDVTVDKVSYRVEVLVVVVNPTMQRWFCRVGCRGATFAPHNGIETSGTNGMSTLVGLNGRIDVFVKVVIAAIAEGHGGFFGQVFI